MTDKVVRPFGDWLREQAAGSTHDELSEALHALVEAVQLTGKKGSLTLIVEIKPIDGTNTDTLTVSDRVSLKAPQLARPRSVFFADKSGNLRRDNPNQLQFEPLREVPAPAPIVTPKAVTP